MSAGVARRREKLSTVRLIRPRWNDDGNSSGSTAAQSNRMRIADETRDALSESSVGGASAPTLFGQIRCTRPKSVGAEAPPTKDLPA
ncbi:DUF6053 domain-containing protein [Lysobacter sp. CA199]|uniref:DUF6053 domain-containing protein n=1 Tax=Lysobacter sp. CA199 TaxID=3455608 RepID=UPI003F8D606C